MHKRIRPAFIVLCVLVSLLPFCCKTVLPSPALSLSAGNDAVIAETSTLRMEARLAAGDALRITVALNNVKLKPLPDAMKIEVKPSGTSPVQSGNSWLLGPYTLAVSGRGLSISKEGQPRFDMRFEKEAGAVRVPLALRNGDALYGMGECVKSLALGPQRLVLNNHPVFGDQTYLYVPYFFGSAGDAFLFEAAGNDAFSFRNSREVDVTSAAGRIDLVYWQDVNPASLTARFYEISGSRSLLPRWSYGFIQSKYGYRTDAQLKSVVAMFRQSRIPLSAVVLDLYWYRRMGDLEWDRKSFPDPEGLDAWLESMGVKLITISEPFFTLDSQLYEPFAKAGIFATEKDGVPTVWKDWWSFGGNGGSVINPVAESADTLLASRYAAIAGDGVDGFWTDLGEPENVPASARFGQWTEAEFHQAFNKEWSRIVRDAWRKAFPGQRPFILSRSGYLGSAGYGISIWSGDAPSTWSGLGAQIPLGLQAGLSGFPFWGSDAGGFITEGGEQVLPEAELYLRWLQFASYTPTFRAHGWGPREPWIFGEEWLQRTRAVIENRYRLLPYVYSTAYQVWSEGVPMMRPLFFLDPSDPRLLKEDSSYLFGDWLLVSPVTKPLSAERKKAVYLPRGTWYDCASMARYEGGAVVEVPLSLDTFPVFAREGAIIPITQAGQESYILIPGRTPSHFVAFSDDGTSEEYRSGAGEKLQLDLDANGVTIAGAASTRDIDLLLPRASVRLSAFAASAVSDGVFWRVRVTIRTGENRFPF
jgi:oligosaccharide 4-alpha-D-glucosyltransferase